MRKLIGKLLERRGFEMREAENAEAALAAAESERLAVVVCDAAVRHGGDFELAAALSARDRSVHFVLIADKNAAPAAAARRDVRVLEKPFTASDLDAALADAGVAAPRAG